MSNVEFGRRVHRQLEKQWNLAFSYGGSAKFWPVEYKTAPKSPDLIVLDEADDFGKYWRAVRAIDLAMIEFRKCAPSAVLSINWAARERAREAYRRPSQDAAAERLGVGFLDATEAALKRAGLKFTRVQDEYIIEETTDAQQKLYREAMRAMPSWMYGTPVTTYAKAIYSEATPIEPPRPVGKLPELAAQYGFRQKTPAAPQPMWVDHKTRSYEPPNHGPAVSVRHGDAVNLTPPKLDARVLVKVEAF